MQKSKLDRFIQKYKLGGKHFSGVDCSGLVQLFLNFNNKFCPRDTKDQIKYLKKKIQRKNVKKTRKKVRRWCFSVQIARRRRKKLVFLGSIRHNSPPCYRQFCNKGGNCGEN